MEFPRFLCRFKWIRIWRRKKLYECGRKTFGTKWWFVSFDCPTWQRSALPIGVSAYAQVGSTCLQAQPADRASGDGSLCPRCALREKLNEMYAR